MVKQITQKRLENIALYYLQRYESSCFKLENVLKRRILRTKMQGAEIPADANKWVVEVVQKMQNLGYIDDKRYAENTLRRLQNAGKSVRFIMGKLKQDGILPDTINTLMDAQEKSGDEMDIDAARRFVDKKKLGWHRPPDKRQEMYQKDLAALGRAGFSYETAARVLKEND